MFRIVSGDVHLLHHIHQEGFSGRVHSVFTHAVNLTTPEAMPELWSIVCAGGDHGPNTLVADIPSFTGCSLHPGDSAAGVTDGHAVTLCVGEGHYALRFCLDAAAAWEGPRLVYPRETGPLRDTLRNVRDLVHPGLHRTGAPPTPFEHKVRELLLDRTRALMAALGARRVREAQHLADGLIGLGVGLTPSGDDVLLGLIAAMTIQDAPSACLYEFWHHVAAEAARKTNLISATGIRAAAHGRMRETLSACLLALLHGSVPAARQQLAAVLAIGSSSGADLAYGMLQGLELNLFLGDNDYGDTYCH